MNVLPILPILLFSLLAFGQSPNPAPSTSRLKIVVDAGHGGEDAGAKGRKGLKEKDAALDLAQDLARSLEGAGFEAILTRRTDVFVPLWERARAANEAGADLFLSLHFNGARARSARGSEVFFLSLDAGDADAAAIAALENAGAPAQPGPDGVVASILDDLAQKAYLQDSERLAVAIQTQLNRLGGIKERGVKQAPFAVLRGAAMPAVLVEAAFISNPKEEARLKDAAFRRRLAEAVALGVRRFFIAGAAPVRRKAIAGPMAAGAPRLHPGS